MSDQFNFWAAWVLQNLYKEHPIAIEIHFSDEISINFFPNMKQDEYFEGLMNFLEENDFIKFRDNNKQSDDFTWICIALSERGYRTISELPSSLKERVSLKDQVASVLSDGTGKISEQAMTEIGGHLFGRAGEFLGGVVRGIGGG